MLVCSTEDEVNVEDTDSPKKKDKDKKFLWNHGSEYLKSKAFLW